MSLTEAAPVKELYDKVKGCATVQGQAYEYKLAALLFIRALNSGHKFYLASNLAGAGAFDDIVLKYQLDDSHWTTSYVQLKHKPSGTLNLNSLSGPKGGFSLKKYHESYREIKKQFTSTENNSSFFQGSIENCIFVLYTCAKQNRDIGELVKKTSKGDDVNETTEDLFFTECGENDVFSFCSDNDEAETLGIDAEDGKDFLNSLKIFSRQPTESSLDKFITSELQKRYKFSREEAEGLTGKYVEAFKEWWQDDSYILQETDTILIDVFNRYVVDIRSIERQLTFRSEITFKHTSHLEDTLSSCFTSLNIVYDGHIDTRLGYSRVLQILNRIDKAIIFLDMKRFLLHHNEVIAVWHTGNKHCLVVMGDIRENKNIGSVNDSINDVLNSNRLKQIVLISKYQNTIADYLKITLGDKHEAILDVFPLTHLEEESSVLDVSVIEKYVAMYSRDKKICADFLNLTNSQGQSALCYAYTKKDHKLIDYLTTHGANPFREVVNKMKTGEPNKNKMSFYGDKTMMWASEKGFHKIINQLVEQGVEITTTDDKSINPLMLASSAGHLSVVKTLIESLKGDKEKVVDYINKVDACGSSSISKASEKGLEDIVRYLIEQGGDVRIYDKNLNTPLILAAFRGHLKVINTLVGSFNGDAVKTAEYINHKNDWYGITAISWACHEGFPEVVKLLLAHGADIETTNRDIETPLILAAKKGRLSVVEILLDTFKDDVIKMRNHVNNVNAHHVSALAFASFWGFEKVVELLIEKGGDVVTTNKDKDTPLILASKSGFLPVVEVLLNSFQGDEKKIKGYVNAVNSDGISAMAWASYNGHPKIVEVLLQHGADVEITNKYLSTPLILACEGGHISVVKVLLESFNEERFKIRDHINKVNTEGYSAISMASKKGITKAVELLLQHGADVEITNTDLNTPLILACEGGHESVVKVLIASFMQDSYKIREFINKVNTDGYNAVSMATKKGFFTIVELLTEHFGDVPSTS